MKVLRFFQIPDTFEPEEYRIRRITNIILWLLIVAALIAFASVFSYGGSFWETVHIKEAQFLLGGTLVVLVLCISLVALNRSSRVPQKLVGWILVAGLFMATSISDSPYNLTHEMAIAFLLPITVSAIVLPPASALIVNIAVTIFFAYAAGFQWRPFSLYILETIYILSFVIWLGMSVANKAIRDARNESQKNRAILNGVTDGVVVVGLDNRITLANPAAQELMSGEIFKILSAAESVEICGRFLSLRWSTIPGVGRVAIARDISRQVEIDRAKDAVLGVVSHEMRTPLAAILGLTDILASGSIAASDGLTRIRTNAQRMIVLVDGLLDQAYIEAGALKMHNENFAPVCLANAIQEAFGARSREQQITFNVAVSKSLPELLVGDLPRYQQILTNLVDNAIKFTNAGGSVDVLLTPLEHTDKWQMIVRDTGIGIPPERLPDIFLPFRRASDYTTRSHQGVGLGLSIANRIAQLARGDIQVQSTVGQGSTFIVILPIDGGAR